MNAKLMLITYRHTGDKSIERMLLPFINTLDSNVLILDVANCLRDIGNTAADVAALCTHLDALYGYFRICGKRQRSREIAKRIAANVAFSPIYRPGAPRIFRSHEETINDILISYEKAI